MAPTDKTIEADTDTVRDTGKQLLTLQEEADKLIARFKAVHGKITADGSVDGRVMPAAKATADKLKEAIDKVSTDLGTIKDNLGTTGRALTGEADGLEDNDQAGKNAATGIST